MLGERRRQVSFFRPTPFLFLFLFWLFRAHDSTPPPSPADQSRRTKEKIATPAAPYLLPFSPSFLYTSEFQFLPHQLWRGEITEPVRQTLEQSVYVLVNYFLKVYLTDPKYVFLSFWAPKTGAVTGKNFGLRLGR